MVKGLCQLNEIQSNRILHNWSSLYDKQLAKGKLFDNLRPVFSIWIMNNNIFDDTSRFHDEFGVCSLKDGRLLTDHMAIHVLELNKLNVSSALGGLQQWLCFFKHSNQLLSLPTVLTRSIMRQAMTVLEEISDKEENYYQYIATRNAMIEQATLENQREQARIAAEEAIAMAEQARVETEQAKVRLHVATEQLPGNIDDLLVNREQDWLIVDGH